MLCLFGFFYPPLWPFYWKAGKHVFQISFQLHQSSVCTVIETIERGAALSPPVCSPVIGFCFVPFAVMLVHNAAHRGEQPLPAEGTRPGGVTRSPPPPPPPPSLGHLFRDCVLQCSLWLRRAGLMVGPQLTLMGTRIEGVDIGALRSLIFKLSQGGEKRSAWTNSVARLCKMKITLTLIAVNFKKKKTKNKL